ncbi:MAG: hypothetical protein LBD82_02960 [Deltaproteobacteria bacterium]|jgi:hypothetical protein|nr:hypothetical protein [Deltaproteobacteria bacterium]
MKTIIVLFLTLALPLPLWASEFTDWRNDYEDQLVYGDRRLACEAILCLSSIHQPPECRESLIRYYAIKVFEKHVFNLSKTIRAREQFLQMCPTVKNEASSSGDFNSLIQVMSSTINDCSVYGLNQRKIYYARAFDVLKAVWSEWKILGRNNNDYNNRKQKYYFDKSAFPDCTQRQLDYAAKLAAGQEQAPWSDDDGVAHYPIPLVCYQSREEADPVQPEDCKQLYQHGGTEYGTLKYENGRWRN